MLRAYEFFSCLRSWATYIRVTIGFEKGNRIRVPPCPGRFWWPVAFWRPCGGPFKPPPPTASFIDARFWPAVSFCSSGGSLG